MTMGKEDQDLRRLFQRERPPEIDLSVKVMKKLKTEQQDKGRLYMKHKVKLLVAAGMLVAVSSAFGASHWLSLKDSKGNVVYEEKAMHETPSMVTPASDLNWMGRVNAIWDNELKAGEAGIIYVEADNPEQKLELRFNPFELNDAAAFQEKLGHPELNIPASLEGGYSFKRGTIHFGPAIDLQVLSQEEKHNMAQELRAQAEQSGKDYAIKPVEFTDEFWNAKSVYAKGEEEVSLLVLNLGDGKNTASWEETIQMTKTQLQENGKDAILTQYADSARMELVWIVEDPYKRGNYQFSLESNSDDIDAEELKLIWKALLQ